MQAGTASSTRSVDAKLLQGLRSFVRLRPKLWGVSSHMLLVATLHMPMPLPMRMVPNTTLHDALVETPQ